MAQGEFTKEEATATEEAVDNAHDAFRRIVLGDHCPLCGGSRGAHMSTCPLSGVVPASVKRRGR